MTWMDYMFLAGLLWTVFTTYLYISKWFNLQATDSIYMLLKSMIKQKKENGNSEDGVILGLMKLKALWIGIIVMIVPILYYYLMK